MFATADRGEDWVLYFLARARYNLQQESFGMLEARHAQRSENCDAATAH
jgi:hypothetical protein